MASHADVDRDALGLYPDAARRLSDTVTLHLTVDPLGAPGRWLAFRLADGECRPTTYESKRAAMRDVGMFAAVYAYAQIHPMGMSPRHAASYIKTCRAVAENPRLRWRQLDYEAPAEDVELTLMPFNLLENLR